MILLKSHGSTWRYLFRLKDVALDLGIVRVDERFVAYSPLTPCFLQTQVTNISDLRIHSRGVVAGEKLEVRLGAKLTRGGKILNVYETLWRGDETLIAHAEIVLLCMDNETRKFRPMPSWVQDLIKVSIATRAD